MNVPMRPKTDAELRAEGWREDALDAYRDATRAERDCRHCGTPFRGPGIYCSAGCALAAT
jgi:hypothetical protein